MKKQFVNNIFRNPQSNLNWTNVAEGFLSKVNVSCIVLASTHYYQSRTFAVVTAKRGILNNVLDTFNIFLSNSINNF